MSGIKLGGGGNIQQGFDNEGKYTSTVEIDNSFVENWIYQYAPEEIKERYKNSDEKEKNKVLKTLQERIKNLDTYKNLVEERTQKELNESFGYIDSDTFSKLSKLCAENSSKEDLEIFYNDYMGAGATAFELNKCARMGWEAYIKNLPTYSKLQNYSNAMLKNFSNREWMESRIEALNRLANNSTLPINARADRYVGDAYLTGQFHDFMTEKFGERYTNSLETNQYGVKKMKQGSISIDELEAAFKNLIGQRVANEKSYYSVSAMPQNTHMGFNATKYLHFIYDIPKGTNVFMSNYQYESEWLIGSNSRRYIKNVYQTTRHGNKELVIVYGFERK